MTRTIQLILIGLLQFFSISLSAKLLPVEAFGNLPEVRQVKLSPDGKQIAFIRNINHKVYLGVTNIPNGTTSYIIGTDNQKFKMGWYVWANNEVILLSADYPVTRHRVKFTETRLLKLNSDGKSKAQSVVTIRHNERSPQFQNKIVDLLPDQPDHILMALDLNIHNTPAVYKINLSSRNDRERIYKAKIYINNWMTDRQHRLRLGFGRDDTKIFYRLFDIKTEKWRNIWEYEIFDVPDVTPLGFGLNPNELYVRANHKGRYALFKVDLTDPELSKELVYADENYDIEGSLIYSKLTNDVVGIYHGEANDAKVYFEPSYADFQKSLNKSIPDAYNNITSISADERTYILFSSSSEAPGAFYLGNKDTNKLSFLLEKYPLLFQKELSDKSKITYKARDGIEIEGYLTAASKETTQNNAAIIIPHGGPMSRNYGGFDWFSQFFASRGYTILEPNFRGSSGYGFTFEMESIKKWGGAMQDDLADAAHWLVENRNIDKNKICILGASYGGYAALMAAVKQQDTFRCAASFAGVSDLELVISKARKFTNSKVVKKQIGDDSDLLEKNSPINFAKTINIPVMLIHGEKDRVVDIAHSRRMFDELDDYDKTVEFIELENGNHYLEIEENRIKTLASFERFLKQHLGNTE